jgi:penicillin-binding protein 1A
VRRQHAYRNYGGYVRPRSPRGLSLALIPLVMAFATGLVAAGLIPAVATAGKAVTRFDRQFLGETEPLKIKLPALPERSTIYAADGTVLATLFENENRVYVPLDQIDDVAKKAVLSIEDHSFYRHGPLDVTSIVRAALANLRAGHIVQGGSTITQQLVKNTETGNAETFARKFQEAQDAVRLERSYSKDEILELYLNEIYLGHRVYGLGTAAEYYFNRKASELTLTQAATLAGMIASPVALDPIAHGEAAVNRRNVVLAAMRRYGWITEPQFEEAAQGRIVLSAKGRTANQAGPEPYWISYIVHQFESDPRFGPTTADRHKALFQGGLRIYTTLRLRLQRAARQAINNHFPNPGLAPPADPEAALVSIVPQTGAIQAMVSGKNYQQSQFDLASQGGRSTGSAFKAFTLAAAFEQGYTPDKVYDSASPVDIPLDKCFNIGGDWMPGNAEPGTGGIIDLRTATALSVNVVFAQLIADLGPDSVALVARRMGLTGYIPAVCSITLGAVKVSPLAMTSAYTTLANGGVHCQPYSIGRVASRTGQTLFRATPTCRQAIPPDVAAQVTDLLRGVIKFGTGTRAQLPDYGTRPEAGKTGTGEEHDDAWFMGYITQLCAGVWVGYSKDEKTPLNDLPKTLGGFGGTTAAPIWHDYMAVAEKGLPVLDFPTPPPTAQGTVPSVVGLQQDAAEKAIKDAKFTPIAHEVDSFQPAGTVVSQTPPGGSTARLGSGVTIMVSNGKGPAPGVSVPSVVGLTEGSAVSILKAAGFRVLVTYRSIRGDKKAGIVLDQSPHGGAHAPQGSQVVITVGKRGPLAPVRRE